MKSHHFLAPLVLIALGACGQADKTGDPGAAPSQTASGVAVAGPDAKPGIAVTEGVLILPVVKGRPGAAYFTLANGSTEATTLAAVTIDGAGKAEMHETKGGSMAPLGVLEVKPGETVKFERGGKHVMAFDLADTVAAGGTAEMTLTFAGGDKISVPLKIEAGAGAGMGGGMAH